MIGSLTIDGVEVHPCYKAAEYLSKAEDQNKVGGDPDRANTFAIMALAAAVLSLAHDSDSAGIADAVKEVSSSIDGLEINR